MAPLYLPALFLLFAGLCLAEVVSLRTLTDNRITDLAPHVHIRKTHDSYASGINEPLDLLDIVLVASVDGNLHALNRTSGHVLWTISSSASASVPSSLGPLVRTRHPDAEFDFDGEEGQDVYVIEPQSGEIYVTASPNTPLQRLPFSMPQLVEMSPYSMSGDDGSKLFVGKKETSLLLVELETGRIKATVNPSSECIWDPFEDLSRTDDNDEIDLDELEGSKPSRMNRPTTEVFIGRTDYHLSILTRPTDPNAPRPPVQNLSFSSYGPNNQDHALQTIYRRTADEMYIQSLPNGKILSFKTQANAEAEIAPSAHLVWAQAFANPIVAVFDVVKSASRGQPFVLLQPRVGLQDLLPNVDIVHAAKEDRLSLDAAYVGMVGDSLYAMSPERYPFVMLGDANFEDDYAGDSMRGIDPPPGLSFDTDSELPPVDSITRAMKRRKLKEMCRNGSKDRRCMTGIRRLESSRLSRLLDGAVAVPYPPYDYSKVPPAPDDGANDSKPNVQPGNTSTNHPLSPLPKIEDTLQRRLPSSEALSTYVVAILALVVAVFWMFFKKDGRNHSTSPTSVPPPIKAEAVSAEPPPSMTASPLPDSALSDTADAKPMETVPVSSKPTDAEEKTTTAKASGKRVTFGEAVKASGVEPDGLTDGAVEGEESEADTPTTPGKRKPIRRRRGKKKKAGVSNSGSDETAEVEKEPSKTTEEAVDALQANEDTPVHVVSPSILVVPPPTPDTPVIPSLVVSDTVLGYGSHGTVVFKGALQGRAVAVKRLLQDFVTLATREVNVLQESDDHPNVIRYYYQEARAGFLYIALELCPASLADVVERPDQFREIAIAFDPKKALQQITSGLRHLHALKIIHRDIKPQNILISSAKKGVGESAGHRMLISDFGLCKKLDLDQTSFVPTVHGAMAAGTVGWRAPEILRGEVKLDDTASEESQSSRGSVGPGDSTPTGKPARLTKSVDIFALGCLFYYVLSNGSHPFGDRYEREANIFKNVKCLDGLERFGEEGADAIDLINKMLSPEARDRPDTTTCLLHPYFWNPGKRLNFLQDASDRFEIMCRDPKDAMLLELETGAFDVVGNDWNARLDKWFIENLGKYRKYDGKSVQDLLRALRNKKHHYQDLPDNVKRQIGSMPEGFLSYFTKRFPHLFLHVHEVIATSPLRRESMFRTYFELTD